MAVSLNNSSGQPVSAFGTANAGGYLSGSAPAMSEPNNFGATKPANPAQVTPPEATFGETQRGYMGGEHEAYRTQRAAKVTKTAGEVGHPGAIGYTNLAEGAKRHGGGGGAATAPRGGRQLLAGTGPRVLPTGSAVSDALSKFEPVSSRTDEFSNGQEEAKPSDPWPRRGPTEAWPRAGGGLKKVAEDAAAVAPEVL